MLQKCFFPGCMTKSLCDSSVCSKCRLYPSTVRCVGNGGLDKRRLSLLTVQINSTFLIKLQRLAGFMTTFQANYFHPAVGETFACLWMWHEGKLCWRLLGWSSAGICHHCRVITLNLSKVSFFQRRALFWGLPQYNSGSIQCEMDFDWLYQQVADFSIKAPESRCQVVPG